MRRQIKQMGLTRLGSIPPPPVVGLEQRRITVDPDRPVEDQLPLRCDKCGNPRLRLEPGSREVHCAGTLGGCGRTWYVVTAAAALALGAAGAGRTNRNPTARKLA